MSSVQRITPCLWFHDQAEAAAHFYISIFSDSRIVAVSRYGEAGHQIHGRPAGSVLTVEFELEGQRFTALNGGPVFNFNEAVSFQVGCDSQREIDYYWERLSEDGDEKARQCGWLKDRYGLSWQVVPNILEKMLADPAKEKTERVMTALLKMKKLDIEALVRAFNG